MCANKEKLEKLRELVLQANQDACEGNDKSIFYALEEMAEVLGIDEDEYLL